LEVSVHSCVICGLSNWDHHKTCAWHSEWPWLCRACTWLLAIDSDAKPCHFHEVILTGKLLPPTAYFQIWLLVTMVTCTQLRQAFSYLMHSNETGLNVHIVIDMNLEY
jgi:hypothetical protein